MLNNNFYSNVYNPDVLSTLANLSSDEVFTPPDVVNDILDLLPEKLWTDSKATFLDPAAKSGVFLREIAKRLIEGLKDEIPDLQERLDHIFQNQLYGIAITELTSLLARRSLYGSKYANSMLSFTKFDDPIGNIKFRIIQHTWEGNRCKYCGASKSEYKRDVNLETHAYEFIHTKRPEEIFKMKFDVIIGNPPYQLSDGGAGASAKPMYHLFVEQAMKMNPRYLSMIIPARWYAGGKGLDEFRELMLGNNHITHLVDYADSAECFAGVNIAGGVCYFLWERDNTDECKIINVKKSKKTKMKRSLNEFPFLVRDNIAITIIRKVLQFKEARMTSLVKARNPFGITTNFVGNDSIREIKVLTSRGNTWTSKSNISDRDRILNKYKVIITRAMSGGHKPSSAGDYIVLSSLRVMKPGEAFSETYLCIGDFNKENYADNLLAYASTKFFRFLLLQALSSINITRDKFIFVPQQDFSKPWTDEELYKKYDLDQEEIDFIESMISLME
ncbi:MAG: restriction endonuclease [Clostridiales bacterium]|nr:restriction endonuclease [Clostridiales bacterium]